MAINQIGFLKEVLFCVDAKYMLFVPSQIAENFEARILLDRSLNHLELFNCGIVKS